MPQPSTQRRLSLPDPVREAVALHQRAVVAAVEKIYKAILAVARAHADTLHLLGALHSQNKRPTEAVPPIRRAPEINPRWPVALVDLGHAERALGQPPGAIAAYVRPLQIDPPYPYVKGHATDHAPVWQRWQQGQAPREFSLTSAKGHSK